VGGRRRGEGVAGLEALGGGVEAKLDLRAKGASLHNIMPTLAGSADFSVKNGKIRHISIAKMIRALAADPLTGWQESEADSTDISRLSAFFSISDGQASTDNFQLAGPLVQMMGKGSVNIAAKRLRFKLDPELILSHEARDGSENAIGLGVPVIVQGTWTEPRIYPDIAGVLEDPAAAYAKLRALGKGLFDSTIDLNAGIDALTKGVEELFRSPLQQPEEEGEDPAEGGGDPPPVQEPNLDLLRDLFRH